MNAETYRAVQEQLEFMAQIAMAIDPDTLNEFIQQAERSDAVGPVLHPSEWLRGRDRLRDVIDSARALGSFRAAIQRVAERQAAEIGVGR